MGIRKLPDDILQMIHSKTVRRESPNDSNFNYVHQEDVFDIARAALDRVEGKGDGWISVKDRMPEREPEDTFDKKFVLGWHTHGGGVVVSVNFIPIKDGENFGYTHWKPIQPPAGQGD